MVSSNDQKFVVDSTLESNLLVEGIDESSIKDLEQPHAGHSADIVGHGCSMDPCDLPELRNQLNPALNRLFYEIDDSKLSELDRPFECFDAVGDPVRSPAGKQVRLDVKSILKKPQELIAKPIKFVGISGNCHSRIRRKSNLLRGNELHLGDFTSTYRIVHYSAACPIRLTPAPFSC